LTEEKMSPRMIAGKKIKAILYQLVPWVYLLKTASHLSATCAQESSTVSSELAEEANASASK